MRAVMPPSVNFHLWQPCNMRCGYCFATFEDVRRSVLPAGHLPEADAVRVTRALAHNFRKITFVGGEPTLCGWLPRLIQEAKDLGATTMLVTNGTRLTTKYLERLGGALDWVTLSFDSAIRERHVQLGRAVNGRAFDVDRYSEIAAAIRLAGISLKINTVVTSVNVDEDLTEAMRRLQPQRWKIFQVLPVEGQNDAGVLPLLISRARFESFVLRHRGLTQEAIEVVPENNDAMRGSYAMVDPAGRFFDNSDGGHTYSRPILDVGLEEAWNDIHFDIQTFLDRGGLYAWDRKKTP